MFDDGSDDGGTWEELGPSERSMIIAMLSFAAFDCLLVLSWLLN
jgi:hypothetical protein